jgi:hypothetical protein
MPVQSTLAYLKGLLDGLAMPGGIPSLVAYITPPAVDDEPNGEPRAYIWPSSFEESRNPERHGTVPRALAMPVPNTSPNSGFKPIDHQIHVYLIYDQDNDDPQADSLFPGIIDAVSWQLRVSLDPATIYDEYTGLPSALLDVGEQITGSVAVRALAGQRYYRYDCLLILPIMELIQS